MPEEQILTLEKLELQMSWNNAKINAALGIENNPEQLNKIAEAIWGEKYRVDDYEKFWGKKKED